MSDAAKRSYANGRKAPWQGKHFPLSARKKMSSSAKGRKASAETRAKLSLLHRGSNHWNWREDRNSLVKKQVRNDSAYFAWRRSVWERDDYKCRINNSDCRGKIEAHHILKWRDYPELRYEIKNGITLCHGHHPRKEAEEKRLIPTFQELVSVSK